MTITPEALANAINLNGRAADAWSALGLPQHIVPGQAMQALVTALQMDGANHVPAAAHMSETDLLAAVIDWGDTADRGEPKQLGDLTAILAGCLAIDLDDAPALAAELARRMGGGE